VYADEIAEVMFLTSYVTTLGNELFATDDNEHSLQFLGVHSELNGPSRDISHHFLSHNFRPTSNIYLNHLLAKHEGPDWLFQLYNGEIAKKFETEMRTPLARVVLSACVTGTVGMWR
jgi:hypothetical protein